MERIGKAILAEYLIEEVCSPFVREDFSMTELVTKQDLTLALETQTLRLTERLGAMLAVAIGALATVLKLT
jgi:hypothetical protein